MHAEGYFLVKNDFNIPHSATGAKVMPSRVRFSRQSTITSTISEFRSRKLEATQVFLSLRHSCSLNNWCGFLTLLSDFIDR